MNRIKDPLYYVAVNASSVLPSYNYYSHLFFDKGSTFNSEKKKVFFENFIDIF